MNRRTFLKSSACGMAAVAGTGITELAAKGQPAIDGSSFTAHSPDPKGDRLGRPVRIASIGFAAPLTLKEIEYRVEVESSRGADLIILPELCRGLDRVSEEPLHGPTVTAMSKLAGKHRTYVAVPIDRRDRERRLNSVVLLDRSGQVVCVYDKVFPYWSEYKVQPPVSPGDAVQVFQADFGRVGIATCFDANFPEVWQRLADKGAELVIWPSAYSGGISLQAHAINHHYYIVSCSHTPDCVAYDITGERIFYQQNKDVNVSRITVDLDRGIYHENFNLDKRDKLLHDRPGDIMLEQWMKLEQWFVLKAGRPGVSARELAHEYGLEELRHYIDRSRVSIDKRRGWEFEERVAFPGKSLDELRAFSRTTDKI